MAAEKARLRAQFRAARAALSEAAWAAASGRMVAQILALPLVEAARTVHVFWPLIARREVDTRPLILALAGRGVRVALPVVVSGPGEPPRLIQRLYTHADALKAGRFGVEEPTGPEISPAALDVAVVPALGAARDGHRLGYGAGFYDSFLARVTAPVFCPVYATCVVDRLPHDRHDRPVDIVVTETETLEVGQA